MLDERHYEVLRKYIESRIVEDERDVPILRRYASIGYANFGILPTPEKLERTASLTDLGRSAVLRESIRRNPIRNLIYHVLNFAS